LKTIVLNRSKLIIDENSPKACLKKINKTLRPFRLKKVKSIRPASSLFYKTDEIIENRQREIGNKLK
jgi:hypothetical protein